MALPPKVDIGTAPNNGTGDPLRIAFQKLNARDGYLDVRIDSKIDQGGNTTDTGQSLRDDIDANETPTGAQTKADTAEQNAKDYADSLGATLLTKPSTYTGGAQTFTADFDIVQVDSLLVENTPLLRTQYTVSGAVVTITDKLIVGAVIELNYWKANAVNSVSYTKAESNAIIGDINSVLDNINGTVI